MCDVRLTGRALEQLSSVWHRGVGQNQFGRHGTVRLRSLTLTYDVASPHGYDLASPRGHDLVTLKVLISRQKPTVTV